MAKKFFFNIWANREIVPIKSEYLNGVFIEKCEKWLTMTKAAELFMCSKKKPFLFVGGGGKEVVSHSHFGELQRRGSSRVRGICL